MFSSVNGLNHPFDYRTAGFNPMAAAAIGTKGPKFVPFKMPGGPGPRRRLNHHSMDGLVPGHNQVFVQVAYDFEYVAEDGTQVVMNENEILLLINKTNHDWWQVSIS